MTAERQVSIIIVSYYTGPVLFRAIEAALRQSNIREVILIDNGNESAQRAALSAQFSSNPLWKHVINEQNKGFAAACNQGAKLAQAEYILLLNPDCILPDNSLPQAVDIFWAHPDAWLAGARILNTDGSEQRGARRQLLTPETAIAESLQLHKVMPLQGLTHNLDAVANAGYVPAISGAFMLMKKSRYEALSGLDEGYFLHVEDLDLCMKIFKQGGKILFMPQITPVHYLSTSRVSSAFVEWNKAKSFIYYFRKHYSDSKSPWVMWFMEAGIYARFLLRFLIGWLRALIKNTPRKVSVAYLPSNAEGASLANRHILLTGATSQIGLATLQRLLQEGAHVTALFHNKIIPLTHPKLTWRYANLAQDVSLTEHYTDVVHAAGIWLLPLHIASLSKLGVTRIVAFSSTSLFTKADSNNIQESELAIRLEQAEEGLKTQAESYQITYTVFRPTMVYGLGLDKNITRIAKFIRFFHFFPIVPPASGLRQPVYVGDLAEAVIAALVTEKANNKFYNLSGGEKLTYHAMVERIFSALHKVPRFLPFPFLPALLNLLSYIPRFPIQGSMAERMNKDLVFDHTEASQDFGFAPRTFLSQGKKDLEQQM